MVGIKKDYDILNNVCNVNDQLSKFLDSRVPFDDVPATITVGNENAYIIPMYDTNMWRFFYNFENN